MLDGLLYPNSVAVIGASRTPGKVGSAILSNLINGGYQGKIIPVNPTTDELFGLPCYKDVRDAGINIDHCVIVVPQRFVMDALAGASVVRAKAVTVITAGFKEVGAEGAAKEKEMVAFCRKHSIRILGPNCLGLINTENRMNASFAAQMPKPGNISVLSQSGALCTAILDWAEGRGVGLAKLLSIGNKADLCETDLLRALAQDKQTKVIAAYLRQQQVTLPAVCPRKGADLWNRNPG